MYAGHLPYPNRVGRDRYQREPRVGCSNHPPRTHSIGENMQVTFEMELLELARGIIENTDRGDWINNQSREWVDAVNRWQDRYHDFLDGYYYAMEMGDSPETFQ